jgi:hypothetical protein
VRRDAHRPQELREALAHAGGRELIAEDRSEGERQLRRVLEHVEERQVRRGHRLPQPLLAERPRPVALDVRHVGVED